MEMLPATLWRGKSNPFLEYLCIPVKINYCLSIMQGFQCNQSYKMDSCFTQKNNIRDSAMVLAVGKKLLSSVDGHTRHRDNC